MPKALVYYAYKRYNLCPLWYYRGYVTHQKPISVKDEYHSVFGVVVQEVFEKFYNNQIWLRGASARDIVLDSVPRVFDDVVSKKNVFWDKHDVGQEELLIECVSSVNRGLDTIKDNTLIGPYAKSEVNIYSFIYGSYQIGGRADFIIKKNNGSVLIIDGKGSKNRYVQKDQLYFYALSFYLLHKKLPDSLWFWFYRSINDPLKNVPFDIDTLKETKEKILKTVWDIKECRFDATPSSVSCYFCPYSGECKEEGDFKNKGKALIPDAIGVVDLDF